MTFLDRINNYAVGRLLGMHYGTARGGLWWTVSPRVPVLGDAGGGHWRDGYTDGRVV